MNAAEYDAPESFAVRVASTFRFAVDTSSLDEALVTLAPGISEHPRHPHFALEVDRWLEGRPPVVATSRLMVEEVSAPLVLTHDDAGRSFASGGDAARTAAE